MKVIVIGGGPSGMICAATCAKNGHNVILLDKNEKLGKKLYITGKGRCNLANDTTRDLIIANIVNNPKFMISSLYRFDSASTMAYYENLGVFLKVERGNRVFPVSDKSSDIINAHLKDLANSKVEIKLNSRVNKIVCSNSTVSAVLLDDNTRIDCDCIVLATGGKSYPLTGSQGDGYTLVSELGHNVIEPKPALVPITLKKCHNLQGLSLKNVTASILDTKGAKLESIFGEMLFTHNGASGPIILSLSSYINRLDVNKLTLSIDFKPALSFEKLDNRLLRDFEELSNKNFVNALDKLLPKRIIADVIIRSDIDPRLKVHQIDKNMRNKLVNLIKDFRYDINSLGDFNTAIITSGGVDVREVNPKTMESKLIQGLFLVGEVLDVDALTGGFNIQIALSSGYAAGNSI